MPYPEPLVEYRMVEAKEAEIEGLRGQVAAMREALESVSIARESLSGGLGYHCLLCNGTGLETVLHTADCPIIADIGAPEAAVIEVAVRLREKWKDIPLFGTTWADFKRVVDDMRAGREAGE